MKKMQGVLTGRIFLSSVQEDKQWFSLDKNEKTVECISSKESDAIARHILKNAKKWLTENHRR